MDHKGKTFLLLTLAVLLLLGGLFVFFLPKMRTLVRLRERETAMERFEEKSAARRDEKESPAGPEGPGEEEILPYADLLEACLAYNRELAETGQDGLTARSQLEAPLDPGDYGWKEDVFAVLRIPAAGIEAPVYLGAKNANLERGAAVLGQTSLPVGGTDANCVVAWHRTRDGEIFFDPIRHLEPGDMVYIINPWGRLSYEVIETGIIEPTDIDAIRIREGRDLLTLFTCTYPNTRRVLVICERTEDETE